jgi:glycosyltransferase involved in cell wall biosynthesis
VEVRARYELPERFILSVGTLQPRKNFVRLIEAYGRLIERMAHPVHLVIAGQKGWLFEPIFRRVEELGFKERVTFLGFFADEDLPVLYNLADLFVLPSLYEGFGLPPLEAMACGIPVIASDVSSLPEVLGDAAKMVDPLDVGALANVMHRVLSDEPLRRRMVGKGLARAARFTWRDAALGARQAYEEFVPSFAASR